MERIGSKTVYDGKLTEVRIEEFRYDDGETAEREVVSHPGAVAIVARDDEVVWLVRQPREAVGEPSLLELPAGKLDVEGERPLEAAKRELAEEIGKTASEWEELRSIWMSPGWNNERMWLFHARGLGDAETDPDPGERIEIVEWPLGELGRAIEECEDSKSLVGLLLLERSLRRG